MATRQPAWVKDLIGQKSKVPEQVTVLRQLKPYERNAPSRPMGAIQYTGSGDNGIPEPQRPVDIVNTTAGQQTRHEAELAVTLPDGRVVMVPSNVLGQNAIQYIEQQAQMTGKATGGVYTPKTATPSPGFPSSPPAMNRPPISTVRIPSGSTSIQAPGAGNSSSPEGLGMIPKTPPPPSPMKPLQDYQPTISRKPLAVPPPPQSTATSGIGAGYPIGPSLTGKTSMNQPPPAPTFAPPPVPTIQGQSGTNFAQDRYNALIRRDPATLTDADRAFMADFTKGVTGQAPAAVPTFNAPTPTIQGQSGTNFAQDRYNALIRRDPATLTDADKAFMADFEKGTAKPVVYPPSGDTGTSSTPPPTSEQPDVNQARIEATAQYWENVMKGMEPTDRDLAKWYLSNFDTSSASDLQAMMARISRDPNMGESAKNTMLAQLERNASVGRGQMLGTMAESAIQRKDSAASNLYNIASGERTYADSRSDIEYERKRSEAQTAFNNAITAKDWKAAAAAYKEMTGKDLDVSTLQKMTDAELRNLTAPAVSSSSRISTLFAANTPLAGMKTDQQLREAIAHTLKVDVNDPAVDQEIELQYKAYVASNKGQFAGNTETLIGNVKDNGGTVADALNDPSIRQNVAAFLEVDPNTPDGKRKVDNYISDVWTQISKSPVDRAFETVWNDVIPSQYKDTPGAESATRGFVRDMYFSGQLDANGMPVEGANIVWPWQDASSFYRYVDWNGNDIDYNAPPAPSTELTAEGNGTTYKYTDPVTNEGRAWTFADVEREWKGLNPTEQATYFNGNRFNADLFIRDQSMKGDGGDADPYSPSRMEEYGTFRTDFAVTYTPAFPPEFIARAATGTDGTAPDPFAASIVANPVGAFGYYDEKGAYQVTNSSSQILRNAYWDLSDNLNGGKPLTYEQFTQYWGDGSAWRVNSNGNVLNFNPSFQSENGLTADNKWQLTSSPHQYMQDQVVPWTGSSYEYRDPNTGVITTVPAYTFNPEEMTKTPSNMVKVGNSGNQSYPGWYYPQSIYDITSAGDEPDTWDKTGDIKSYAAFNSTFMVWANQNVGGVIELGGKYYRIDGVREKVRLGAGSTEGDTVPYYADMLVLTDLATGQPVNDPSVGTFGATFIFENTRGEYDDWSK